MKKIILMTFTILTLAACAPIHNTNGIYLTPDDIARVPVNATRSDVLQTLGTPSTTAVFDDNTWYYVGQKTEKKAFFDTKVTARKVYELKFTEEGTMLSLNEVNEDAVNVPLVRRKTPTSGHDLSAAQQLLGNLGRFNKSQTMPGAN
jgi:outer membrane protein assembly factor BamE (lipoprotein component of BamABCDE complex)